MKKIYLLTFSLFALSQVKAQTYTVTQSQNEPVIGNAYVAKGLDTTVVLPMTIAGSNVTWNVTGLVDSLSTDSNTYIDPSADANSSNYPGVTIVQKSSTNVSYFKSSPGLYELLGLDINVGGGTANLNYNTSSAIIAQYPIAYGYSNTDPVSGDISAMGFNGTFTGTMTTVADGTGTLNLNGVSNFTNALRLKTFQHIDFNLSGIINGTLDQTIYNFYNPFSKYPVFTVSYSHIVIPPVPFILPNGIDNMQQIYTTMTNIAIGVRENKKNEIAFKAYPNPANADVSLFFVIAQPESYSVEISNNLGQVVKTMALTNLQPGMYNETINTSDLGSGIYTVKVNGKNAQGTQKLVIQK